MVSLVTNDGLANATAAWHAYSGRAKYIGWGEGSGQGATDTDLDDAADEDRTDGTSSVVTTTTDDDTYQVVGTITATGARSITEAALFDSAGTGTPPSGGDMCVYGDFGVITLATDDAITFTIKVVLDQA